MQDKKRSRAACNNTFRFYTLLHLNFLRLQHGCISRIYFWTYTLITWYVYTLCIHTWKSAHRLRRLSISYQRRWLWFRPFLMGGVLFLGNSRCLAKPDDYLKTIVAGTWFSMEKSNNKTFKVVKFLWFFDISLHYEYYMKAFFMAHLNRILFYLSFHIRENEESLSHYSLEDNMRCKKHCASSNIQMHCNASDHGSLASLVINTDNMALDSGSAI